MSEPKAPWDKDSPAEGAGTESPKEQCDNDASAPWEKSKDEKAAQERERLNRSEQAKPNPADTLGLFYKSAQEKKAVPPLVSGAQARELLIRRLDTIPMRSIEWLWTGWIPKGYITIWAGETGAGKSTVLADIAARVTTGMPWPGETSDKQRPPSRVLWLGSEDGIQELTIPRLIACGANLNNALEIHGVMQGGLRSTFSMQDDLSAVRDLLLAATAEKNPFSLLVIDPITSYLPGRQLKKVDLNDAGQLRTILEPWLQVAQENEIAIVCVTHFAKDTQRSMLHRVLGSSAFVQTCRSLCAVVAKPAGGQYEKVLIQVKANLPEHPGGSWHLATVKIEVSVDERNGKVIAATKPEWRHLDSSTTADSVIAAPNGPPSRFKHPFENWLKSYFASRAWMPISEAREAAQRTCQISSRWWDDHSSEYLEKENKNGIWMCRPKIDL